MEGKVLMKGKKEEDGGRSEKRWNEEVEGVEEEDGGENGEGGGGGGGGRTGESSHWSKCT